MKFPLLLLITISVSCTNQVKESPTTKTLTPQEGFTPQNPEEQLIYNRALQAVLWGMPAVNTELMLQSLKKAKGDLNQVVYWSKPINSNNQTLTPNPDVIYFNPFYDTRKGPVVLEIPAAEGSSSITGSLDDSWQTAIEDVGPAGLDQGKGGKYLILPPNFKGNVPNGFIPLPSATYTGFAILRSNLTDGSPGDVNRAVAYGLKVKIYPYSTTNNNPQAVYLDLLHTPFGNIIPYDFHFVESLNDFVQREPWLVRDMAMIDQLKTIGIEKGRPFNPDARTKEILTTAITSAHQWINDKYAAIFNPPFYEGTHWALPAYPALVKAISENYADPNNYPIDGRAISYSMAYFSAKKLGSGQFYLMTIKDKDSNKLDGSKLYKLHLPPNVPVNLYWSVTVYNGETHALLQDVPYFSRASTSPGIQKNADGSYDIYFGPKAPEGKEGNWTPTKQDTNFELLARFYGPGKDFFDKVWKMGDVELVKSP